MVDPRLPPGVERAFVTAAAELGMCSAAWLVVDELHRSGGPELVELLNAELGQRYPVLDYVTDRHLAGLPRADVLVEPVLHALEGTRDLVVVGVEARFLDPLLERLPRMNLAVVTDGPLEGDHARVLSNLGGEPKRVAVGDVLRHAGRRAALLTFLYGVDADADRTHVVPSWLRVMGPDVRSSFRSIIGWNVLAQPLRLYPRWLAEVDLGAFSSVV